MGALLIAALVSLSSVGLSRRNLLEQRERNLSTRALINAATIVDKIDVPDQDPQTLFGSLSVAGRPSVVLIDGEEPRAISLDPRYGANTVPSELTDDVMASGEARIMRYTRDDEPLVAAAVPVEGLGVYFEVGVLDDIADSIGNLAARLAAVTAVAGVLGALLGAWASRRVLRPLADASSVAEAVAVGRLDARLAEAEWGDDPDIAPIVSSFNEMVSALQDRIDRDARFTSDVSHELRSPLTTFAASLEVLQNAREEMPERAQTALDLLTSDMTRFRQLVEDLLEISRFDAGAVRVELDDVALVEVVRQAVSNLTSASVPVSTDPRLEGVVLSIDKRRLVRILANFLDNARKYAGGATGVSIELHDSEPPSGDGEDGPPPLRTIHIAVEDQGPGVDDEIRAAIFDRFNRGSQGGSRGVDMGVGLGLSLAAEHARIQGGSVWVENRTDDSPGARFLLALPYVVAEDIDLGLDSVGGEEPSGVHPALQISAPPAGDVRATK